VLHTARRVRTLTEEGEVSEEAGHVKVLEYQVVARAVVHPQRRKDGHLASGFSGRWVLWPAGIVIGDCGCNCRPK